MLSASISPDSIACRCATARSAVAVAAAALLLKQSQFTQAQQQQIEATIGLIAHDRNWTRQHADHWLDQQAS